MAGEIVCDDLIKIIKHRSAKSGIEQPENVIRQTTGESLTLQKYKISTLSLFTI
jgi:hypothetical protein